MAYVYCHQGQDYCALYVQLYKTSRLLTAILNVYRKCKSKQNCVYCLNKYYFHLLLLTIERKKGSRLQNKPLEIRQTVSEFKIKFAHCLIG